MYCFSAVIFLFVFYTTLVSELRSLFIFSFRGRVLQHTIMTCCLAPWVRRRAVQRICKSSLSSRAACRTTNDRPWIAATGFIKILYIIFYNTLYYGTHPHRASSFLRKYILRSVRDTRPSQNKTSSEICLIHVIYL